MAESPITKQLRLLKSDVSSLRDDSQRVTKSVERVDKRIDRLTTSIDTYLKRTETWKAEQKVHAARLKRLQRILIRKKIVTAQELAVLGA